MNHLKHLKKLIKNEVKSCLLEVTNDEYKKLGTKSQRTGLRTLRVFDFDDTIAKTNSFVGVTELDKETNQEIKPKYYISPGEYAVLEKDPSKSYNFDYSDFANVNNPKLIDQTFSILKNIVNKIREEDGLPAVILTARGHDANLNIREFLTSLDIKIPVRTLNSSDPTAKSEWIKKVMLDQNIAHVEFFDDSVKNIRAVNSLRQDPELINSFGNNLKIRTRLVVADK
jgi:hypothetical protein